MELCCLHHQQYYCPLRLLTRHRHEFRLDWLIPRLPWAVVPRPREISLVPLMTFPTFRFPYAGEFFEAASPESSSLPWPSRCMKRSAFPFSPLRANISTLQNSLYGTDCWFALPSQERILRFTTPGRPDAVAACYVALWRLPRPDLHRIVIKNMRSVKPLQGTPNFC